MSKFQFTDVFVSHATRDRKYAVEMTRLLDETIEFDGGLVVCTSAFGYGLEFGTAFERQLREALESTSVLIALVSQASLKSLFCAFEIGAAWGQAAKIKPVLLPGTPPRAIPRPLSSITHMRWGDQFEWMKLIRETARASESRLKVPPEQLAVACQRTARFRAA